MVSTASFWRCSKLSEMERESRQEISERWQSGKFEGKVHPPPTYVCYKCGVPGHYINECDGGSTPHRGVNRDDYLFEKFGGARHRKRFKKSGDECWFCVGSKNTETHLIISIAEHSYLALAKGPLIAGNHCQIVVWPLSWNWLTLIMSPLAFGCASNLSLSSTCPIPWSFQPQCEEKWTDIWSVWRNAMPKRARVCSFWIETCPLPISCMLYIVQSER